MQGKHGTRMVQVITDTWMLQLVLDDPPVKLWNRWKAMRVEYYKRREPQETFRDKRPWAPKSQRIHTLRLENTASGAMWKLLLRENDPDHNPETTQPLDARRLAQGSEPIQAFRSIQEDPAAWQIVKSSTYTLDESLNGRLKNAAIEVDKKGIGHRDIQSLQADGLMDIEV